MWNVIDFVTNSLYVATVALRVVAYNQVRRQHCTARTADTKLCGIPLDIQHALLSSKPHSPTLSCTYRYFELCHFVKKIPCTVILQRTVRTPSVRFFFFFFFFSPNATTCRSQWPRGLRRRSTTVRLLGSWVRIPPAAWKFVCCECCVLSSRGLCDELAPCPAKSYRLWCVVVCKYETL